MAKRDDEAKRPWEENVTRGELARVLAMLHRANLALLEAVVAIESGLQGTNHHLRAAEHLMAAENVIASWLPQSSLDDEGE